MMNLRPQKEKDLSKAPELVSGGAEPKTRPPGTADALPLRRCPPPRELESPPDCVFLESREPLENPVLCTTLRE